MIIKLDGLPHAVGDETVDGTRQVTAVTYDDQAGTLVFKQGSAGNFIVNLTPKK